jgi:predicted DNA-binding ribbon-helix-helix protein
MKSAILKRSVIINGHKTSVSLESDFWEALKEIAQLRQLTAADLIAEIDSKRQASNLSSAVRLHVLSHFQGKGGSE